MVRINELMKRSLSEAIRREISFEHGLITVTAVDVAPDLHNARVYFSVIGSHPCAEAEALKTLNGHRSNLQRLVSREVILKYTPILQFILDSTAERGVRVVQILDDLKAEHLIPDDDGDEEEDDDP
ncbi:30S ribosome-binding factor RbfA [Oscillatoria amoena NRMC-F 0135]|nr:30S ribosome-binding factor RbfA [Oscillatoria amoena NRMC-F 0135]